PILATGLLVSVLLYSVLSGNIGTGSGFTTGAINLLTGTETPGFSSNVSTGSININVGTPTGTGTAGAINIGSTGKANTIQIGNTSGAVAQTINIGNNSTASSTNTLNIGSTIGTSATNIQAGSSGIALGTNTTISGNLLPEAAGTRDLGSSLLEFDELYLADDSGLVLGLDQDATLAYDEATDNRVELTGTGADLFIEDRLSLGVDAKNLSDDGVANDSNTPISAYMKVSIDETADITIPDLVLTEGSAKEGDILVIVNDENDGSHDTFTITNSAGLVQLPGALITLGPNDSVTLIYTDDRWVTLSVSDNL
ncbi:MAG: hypothetical protein AAB459_00550, partial [Patescibacteria group bacterium]